MTSAGRDLRFRVSTEGDPIVKCQPVLTPSS